MLFYLTILLGLVAGGISAFIYENLPFSKLFGVNKLVVRGYKLHHSLYGVFLIILAFFLREQSVFLISVGIGMIIEHYLTGGGLDFITKE